VQIALQISQRLQDHLWAVTPRRPDLAQDEAVAAQLLNDLAWIALFITVQT